MPATTLLCFEIGGTTVRATTFDHATASIGPVVRVPAPNFLRYERDEIDQRLIAVLRDVGTRVLGARSPDEVAVAYPGPIAPDGTILAAPTLAGGERRPFDLRAACRSIWPTARIVVMNDVTAAGHRLVVNGWRDFCIVTIGSGIGNKVFVDGVPMVGPGGRGGEIGHLRLDDAPDAPLCDCGGRGHLGALASGRGVLRALQRAAESEPARFEASLLGRRGSTAASLDNVALVEAFVAGDVFVGGVVGRAAAHLATALAATHLLIGTERFVLVGGFALALGDGFRRLVAAEAHDRSWNLGLRWDDMVVLGDDDEDGALLGAGLAAALVR